jgi:hypothetical protein
MYLLFYEISRIETRMYLTLYFSPMKKTLRVLATLSILASSILFAQPASAIGVLYSLGNNDNNGDVPCSISGWITIENNVVVPGANNCQGIVQIPIGVTSIGQRAFQENPASTVLIPPTVTSIGFFAFGYSNITSIIIPESVTSIGNNAFERADNLTTASIPGSVIEMGTQLFKGDNSLTSVTFGSGITSIPASTFHTAQFLTSVTIPSTVTHIGDNAFWNTYRLTSITIPNGVTHIGEYAFAQAYGGGLTSVTIPDSVIEIGSNAFSGANHLTTVTLGNSLTAIRSGTFAYTGALASITIPNSVQWIGGGAFESTSSSLVYEYCGTVLTPQVLTNALGDRTNTCAPTTATVSAGEIPNSQVATFPTGVTEAVIPATAELPAVKLNFGGTAPQAVTLVPMTENPAPVSVTPFRVTGSTKIVDIQITGSFNGSATVCLDGSATDSLFHFTNDAWVELASRTYDAITGQVCGVTTSFSPFTAAPANTNPSGPGSVIATATGKRSATVSFTAPTDDGGAAITSYTAVSTPGGLTQTLTQATGGTFTFATLQPSTAYTFSVTATNSVGTSAATTSNSVTTVALDVATISSLSFIDNGSGTGGKLVWAGRNIESVLYTGPAISYPGSYSFGAFSSSWNGSIGNLIPATSYTISIYAISADGLGVSKSLTFTTAAKKEEVKDLKYWKAWVEENTFTPGEAASITRLLTNFDALKTSSRSSFLNLPKSRVLTVTAKSLTPDSCSLVSPTAKTNAGLVTALTKNTCTISYTITGRSKAPVTLVKDFVFKKVS